MASLPDSLRPVVLFIRRQTVEGARSIRMQLRPPSLGQVDVNLDYDGQRVDVRLAAETPQTGVLLRKHSAELRAALAESGVNVGQLSVTVGDGRGPAHSFAHLPEQRPPAPPAPPPSAAPAPPSSASRPVSNSGSRTTVDVRA